MHLSALIRVICAQHSSANVFETRAARKNANYPAGKTFFFDSARPSSFLAKVVAHFVLARRSADESMRKRAF
jgi:hypothetical protein